MLQALNLRFTVIQALIIRDLIGRYGRNHLGFVWTFIEPMILCTGVMIIWTLLKEPTIAGIPAAAFVFSGYMPLTLWRHMTGPMARLLKVNTALLYHRPVTHLDILLARGVLEFLSTSLAAGLIYFVLLSFGVIQVAADPGLVLAGWLLTGWYYGAQGVIISVASEFWEPAEKFVQPSNYLQLPLSGVFFMVDMMPHFVQKLLELNPSVSCFELVRAGLFGPAIVTHYDVMYVVCWSAGLSVLAGFGAYHVRERLET